MRTGRLLYECGANWLYATGHPVSDPCLWYEDSQGRTHVPTPDLEMAVFKASRVADDLVPYDTLRSAIVARGEAPSFSAYALELIRADAPDIVEVPADFPLAFADKLRAAGIVLKTPEGPLFFPDRYVKSLAEIEKLAEAQRLNEQALHRAVSVLREADISADGVLFWRGQALTSEIVQGEMNKRAVELGAQAFAGGPIVACGPQGAMPHERGRGPLKANELIVIDTFPRHANGYWGDLTRTFVKGAPSLWQKELYHAVLSAQELAFTMLKAGANGKDVDQAVIDFFVARGFRNGVDGKGNPYGYIHSLGHSVGLELHDPGFGLSKVGRVLPAGAVVSVEPGLYYPSDINGGVGGVRIEDVVAITDNGYQNLTTFPKDRWILD